jgi:polar amino acid transport system substrate-binding protein
MNTLRRRGSALAALILGVGLTAACGSDEPKSTVSADCEPAHDNVETLKEGVLTIGVANFPPIAEAKGPDDYEGVDIDIIEGFAASECLELKGMPGSATVMVQGVQQEKWDTAPGGWYRSKEREKEVSMGYPMYIDQMVIAAGEEFTSFEELKGKKVGVVEGYTFTKDLKSLLGEDLSTYAETALALQDFESGRLDAVIDVATVSASFPDDVTVTVAEPDERIPASLEPAQGSMPFHKEADSLREAFDDYIQGLHESGELKEILEKWGLDPALADVGEPYFV